jgi:DMSO/TMAO reductase YedYZ molybdopterin-dependent catalytic subunit
MKSVVGELCLSFVEKSCYSRCRLIAMITIKSERELPPLGSQGLNMQDFDRFLREHCLVTRRFFVRLGTVGLMTFGGGVIKGWADSLAPELDDALAKLESFMTPLEKFRDVSRGSPVPHSISEEKRSEVGLTRETWRLEVTSDPDHPTRLRQPMTIAAGTALDFPTLMKLAETHAVRFAKVMTCLNIGCPLGTGIWEGVPMNVVVWKTQPVENFRRLFYYGYHNNEPKQMFRSSLPASRVLEDLYDLPPVILCYKLNGAWLTPERGGPVRVVVPEAYGFKSIKWLSHLVLTNLAVANDTYIEGNNDIDSPLKTFAATLSVPRRVAVNQQIPITGYAQVGISGLKRVQVWVCRKGAEPPDDPLFVTVDWTEATILAPPEAGRWGGNLPNQEIPADTLGFDGAGQPGTWPMRFNKVHWAVLLDGFPAGEYTLRSRTVDEKGHPQPMPRPFRKSGHAEIEQVNFIVS